MDYIEKIVPILMLLLAGTVIYQLFLGGNKKSKIERGQKVVFEEKCGGRFDSYNVSRPLLRHSIYENFVVYAYMGKNYSLEFNEIIKIEKTKGLMSSGIRIFHASKTVPTKLVLWSKDLNRLIKLYESRIASGTETKQNS